MLAEGDTSFNFRYRYELVAQGTSNQQQVVVGTVSDIALKVQQTSVTSPALLIMGEVVSANGYAGKLFI